MRLGFLLKSGALFTVPLRPVVATQISVYFHPEPWGNGIQFDDIISFKWVGSTTKMDWKNIANSPDLAKRTGIYSSLQGTIITYPTKRDIRKIIDSKVPAGMGYVIVPWRVYRNV